MSIHLLRRLGLMAIFAVGTLVALAQTTVTVNSVPVANLNADPLNDPALKEGPVTKIITPIVNPAGRSSSDEKGLCNIWLEYGDGGFTTKPYSTRNLRTTQSSPYLFFVPLYDTSKGKDGFITRMMATGSLPTGTPSNSKSANDSLLLGNNNIKITANNYSIVKGEPKVLALTYRIKPPMRRDAPFIASRKGVTHYVVLYYNRNNKAVFNPIATGSSSTLRYTTAGTTTTMPDVRLFNGDVLAPEDAAGLSAAAEGYGNKLVIALGAFNDSASSQDEGNIFITLKTRTGKNFIPVGDSSSILVKYFAVADGQSADLGSDQLSNMYIADSFDPNHLDQSPSCFVLPKGNKQLQYALYFENVGEGPADMVRILFHRPQGLENAALNVQSIQYAGRAVNIADAPFTYRYSQTADKKVDTFFIQPNTSDVLQMLLGTGQPGGGGAGSKGCIRFTLAVSAETPDSLISYAENQFHSHFGSWENAIATNTAKTVYREKECECNDTCIDSGCYIIFGLCWWWWALILLALLLLLWLLLRSRR
jgi:hypothetical protein